MFDHEQPRAETLTGLAGSADLSDLGEAMCGRVSAPPDDLHFAFNANQIASKTWLLDRVQETLGGTFDTVHILGGWYGALGALLLDDARFQVARVLSYDIDPACAPVAEDVNADATAQGRFKALTADAGSLRYDPGGAARNGSRALVINTSCEHMPPSIDWYGRVPEGMLLAVQSNDYFECDEHVNCVADLAQFKTQVPMGALYYEGTLRRRRYSRFMLIGRK